MPRQNAVLKGQLVLGAPPCPSCADQYATPQGRRYIRTAKKTIQKWQCACGHLFEADLE